MLKEKHIDPMLLTLPFSHSDLNGTKILSRALNIYSTATMEFNMLFLH